MTNKSTWTVVYSKAALKDMKSLDHAIQKRVHVFLTDKISRLPDPRSIGGSLGNNLKGIWRYKIAKDYRILCEINDKEVLFLVVHVGHRKNVYDIH